jgi:hypothetical protein
MNRFFVDKKKVMSPNTFLSYTNTYYFMWSCDVSHLILTSQTYGQTKRWVGVARQAQTVRQKALGIYLQSKLAATLGKLPATLPMSQPLPPIASFFYL